MAAISDDEEFRQRMDRIEPLLREVEQLSDPALQARMRELVQSILQLHGAGLQRLVRSLGKAGEVGRALLHSLADDELVGGLLLLHGLHPLDIHTRVQQAFESTRPLFLFHAMDLELLEIRDGVVRLRLIGNRNNPAADRLQKSIEEAIHARASDVTAIEIEDGAATVSNGPTRIALPLLHG
jgi:Fe-S cluster biogenesis protein NfuA